MNATEYRTLVHDGTFAVLDPAGDINGARGTTPDGLFRRDTRHLSRWQLDIDRAHPLVLVPAPDDDGPSAAVLTPPGARESPRTLQQAAGRTDHSSEHSRPPRPDGTRSEFSDIGQGGWPTAVLFDLLLPSE